MVLKVAAFRRFVSAVVVLCFSASACSTAPAVLTHSEAPVSAESSDNLDGTIAPKPVDRVASGFLFKLSNLEDKELNGQFRVNFEGELILPYKVVIHAAGLSLAQLQEEVAKAYRPYFKNSTPNRLELIERSYWIEVRGLAVKPGKVLMKQGSNLDEVIAKSGGLSKDMSAKFVKVSATSGSKLYDLDRYYRTGEPSKLPAWEGGEVVFFQAEDSSVNGSAVNLDRNSVRILGEVRKPGELTYRAGADFLYYFSEAGGPTAGTDSQKIQLFRAETGNRTFEEFSLDQKNGIFPPIRKGDTLVIHAVHPSIFERNIQAASGIAAIVSAAALIFFAARAK